MSQKHPSNKKILLISAALSAPLLCTPLYACEATQEMEEDRTSTKRPAENNFGPGEHRDKKSKTQKKDDELSLDVEQDTQFLKYSFFVLIPEDVMRQISSFLNVTEKNHFALSSKTLYTPARQKLIHEDIRGLKDKEWVNGPPTDTFENYLFNSILWKMGSILLHKTDDRRKISIFNMGPLLEGYAYLQDRFKAYKPSQDVSEAFFFNIHNYHASKNGMLMATHAADHPKGGEDDFLSLIRYVLANGENYVLPDQISEPIGLVERFHRIKMAHRSLINQSLSWGARASQGDFILTYDLQPTTIETIKNTVEAHVMNAQNMSDRSQKLASYRRAAPLCDIVLDQMGADAGAHDTRRGAEVHYNVALNSDDSSQKLTSFKRAAQLWDSVIDKSGNNVQITDIKNAANVYHLAGDESTDPAQELALYTRAAKLYDTVLEHLGSHASVLDVQSAAMSHYNLTLFCVEKSQKLASYIRCAQLYETVIEKLGNNTQIQDIIYAAVAHFDVGHNADDPSQKLASFVRSTQLYDLVLAQKDRSTKVSDLRNAAIAHFYIGLASGDLSQKLISLQRSAQLYDVILGERDADNQLHNIKTAIEVHLNIGSASCDPYQRLSSFMRAAQLCETVLEKMGTEAPFLDLKNAAIAHINIFYNAVDPIQKQESCVRADQLIDAALLKVKNNIELSNMHWALEFSALITKNTTDPDLKKKRNKRTQALGEHMNALKTQKDS